MLTNGYSKIKKKYRRRFIVIFVIKSPDFSKYIASINTSFRFFLYFV
jgi:hypothetical protein